VVMEGWAGPAAACVLCGAAAGIYYICGGLACTFWGVRGGQGSVEGWQGCRAKHWVDRVEVWWAGRGAQQCTAGHGRGLSYHVSHELVITML
jgi:hypothetical protein